MPSDNLRQVNHEATVTNRTSRDIVAAASNRNQQSVVASECDSMSDIARIPTAHNHTGPSIDHRVPDRPDILVGRCSLIKHLTVQQASKCFYFCCVRMT